MEQTIGKRIMENRKRLGLTQDQLAERLGVTAQAVSKWENDQSCPDITMLPKLAEIFGITTDALLGRAAEQEVHEAEVVEEDEPEGIHLQKGNWEFKWDSGKRDAMTFAILVLLVGALTLCSALFDWKAGFWSILWPSVLLVYGLKSLLHRFSFFSLGCSLFGAYFLVDNLGIWELNIGSELIFPIIIVLFGISLLVDALRKPNKPRFTVTHNGKKVPGVVTGSRSKSDFSVDGEEFQCSLAFGEAHRDVNLPRLSGGDASVSFGELVVDLSGCEEIADGCHIEANCSFGELVFIVPSRYRVDVDAGTAFGSIDTKGHPDSAPAGIIELSGGVSFGEMTVKYI